MATIQIHHRTQDTAGQDVAHHQPGTMDATAQQRTFNGFVQFLKVSAISTIVVLIFLALANA